MTHGSRLLRGEGSRRRLVALTVYYAVVIAVVGPMCLSQAGADPGARVPVRIALNVALHTKKTDVATFTTPFPVTVGVAADGSYTIPRGALAFALVDVPIDTPAPALGWLTVRAVAMSDFLGTVNSTTGAATLDGSLELLWSTQSPAPGSTPMLACPVGPFALHLSTATLGGSQLSPQSLRDPTSRTARLVDENLDVGAVPAGMQQCAGHEGSLNVALSLPILPKPVPTTTTVAGSSTTSTTDTTTTTTSTTTTTTTTPPTTEASSTTTTTIGSSAPGAPTDGLGIALDPKVLALEPSPSIVSMLTIAAVAPPVGSPGMAATGSLLSPAPATPTVGGAPLHAPPPPLGRAVEHTKKARSGQRPNKHAQTDAAATTIGAGKNVAPPLYFSPMNFAPRIAPHNSLLAPGPLLNLGESVFARHRAGLSILFVVLLVIPLAAFGLGLVASDFGWRPRIPGRGRRRATTPRKVWP